MSELTINPGVEIIARQLLDYYLLGKQPAAPKPGWDEANDTAD